MDEFLSELKAYNIQFLMVVRSSPFSKGPPQFNMGVIDAPLLANNIRYGYWGDTIGGRPLNDDCYDEEGYYDYEKMARSDKFQEGLKRLVNASEQRLKVAVMCSESDPSLCHRSKLIGRELYVDYDINMQHIISADKLISESAIMTSLTKGAWTPEGDLFGSVPPPYFKSRKPYRKENIVAEPEYEYD